MHKIFYNTKCVSKFMGKGRTNSNGSQCFKEQTSIISKLLSGGGGGGGGGGNHCPIAS